MFRSQMAAVLVALVLPMQANSACFEDALSDDIDLNSIIFEGNFDRFAASINSNGGVPLAALTGIPEQLAERFPNGFTSCEILISEKIPPKSFQRLTGFDIGGIDPFYIYTFGFVSEGQEIVLKFHLGTDFNSVFPSIR